MTTPDTNAAWPASALQAADAAFTALTCDPDPLSLDCAAIGANTPLPAREVPLRDLRDWLLAHPRDYAARDVVWRELILRARLGEPEWVIAAVGMAMPALVRFAGTLAAGYRGDPDDLDAEVLTGFLSALRDRLDLSRPAPYAGLLFAAYRAGRAARQAHESYVLVEDLDHAAAKSRTPRLPYGHADLLVHRAQALGLIDGEDVDAYIDVRLGHCAVEPAAARCGISVDALRMRLSRADVRIADALARGMLSDLASPEAAAELAAAANRRAGIRAGKAAARTPTRAGRGLTTT